MTEDRGRRIEEAFAALRAEDAGRAPSFNATMAAARRRGSEDDRAGEVRVLPFRRLGVGWAAGAGLAAAAVVAALLLRGPDPDASFEQAVASYSAVIGGDGWRSPTASLLDVPGRSLLGTVPAIGAGTEPRVPPTPVQEPPGGGG